MSFEYNGRTHETYADFALWYAAGVVIAHENEDMASPAQSSLAVAKGIIELKDKADKRDR